MDGAQPPSEPPIRVLIVDDEEVVRTALARGLRRLGCETFEASDGESALEAMAAHAPQVMFVDLRMPGMDGHTFLRRAASQRGDFAAVAMSGAGSVDDVVAVLRAGAVDYLKKPWNPTELMAAFGRAKAAHIQRRRDRADRPEAAGSTASTEAAPKTANLALLARVRSGDLPVPAIPAVVADVRSMLKRSNTDMAEIAIKIERDQRLAADIVRMSNTAHYARGGRNTSVREAVVRIGLRSVHGLVETMFLRRAFAVPAGRLRVRLTQVWQHAVARGLAMRALADMMSGDARVHPDTAYLVGLLADVGASMLLYIEDQRGVGTSEPLEAATLQNIQDHHELLSATILERWEFDAEIIDPIRHHHGALPPAAGTTLWALAVLAGGVAVDVTGQPDITAPAGPDPMVIERCRAELQISGPVVAQLMTGLKKEYRSVVDTFGG